MKVNAVGRIRKQNDTPINIKQVLPQNKNEQIKQGQKALRAHADCVDTVLVTVVWGGDGGLVCPAASQSPWNDFFIGRTCVQTLWTFCIEKISTNENSIWKRVSVDHQSPPPPAPLAERFFL